jgi:hypothetical protein
MSDHTAGSHPHKLRLSVLGWLKKYFQTRRLEDHRRDSACDAPESQHADNPVSGVEQHSHSREVSGKGPRAIPSWCEPIDETPHSARK